MAAQPQQPSQDSGYGPIWIAVLLMLAVLGIWYAFSQQIVSFIFTIKLYQATLVSYFTSSIDGVIQIVRNTNVSTVTFEEMNLVSTIIGDYTRWPIIAVLLLLAFFLYRSDITSRYRNVYSMKKLALEEVINWPQINPVVHLDLLKEDINKGPWAMAKPPLDFAQHHEILSIERYEVRVRAGDAVGRYVINRGEAKRIFTMQLGDYWEGVEQLPMHTKALFAIFAGKHGRDKKAQELVMQINRSANAKELDFSGVDELLQKHINSSKLQRITQQHAYVLTVMASMLEAARTDGVFATSDFLWLKPLDRKLWYMLNTVGRQVPFTEVAGPFAHWLVEKELQRKLLVPMVDEAVRGLELAIAEIKYVPKDTDEG